MADFNISFNKIILTEGGYVNDPYDKGGETYLGISRVHHPDSLMWPLIDEIKELYGIKNITSRLKENNIITAEAREIYKKDYWDKLRLDEIPNQRVAHEVFDDAVNRGVGAAIKTIKLVLGLPIDTKFDNETFEKLLEYGK